MWWELIFKNHINEEGSWMEHFLSAKINAKNDLSFYHSARKCVLPIHP